MTQAVEKKGESPITVELECLQCHTHQSVELSPEKFRELSTAWKLSQDCGACQAVTDWSFSEPAVEDEEQVDFWDWLATTGEVFLPPGASPQHERRKDPRVDMRVPLRIASPSGEEEVISENISKGGFCFSSQKAYAIGEIIRVLLQASGSSSILTKEATIVRATASQDGKALYGARLTG